LREEAKEEKEEEEDGEAIGGGEEEGEGGEFEGTRPIKNGKQVKKMKRDEVLCVCLCVYV